MTNPSVWRRRRVFLTGHTGFKGPWLALWLTELGAKVAGFALPPERASSHNHLGSLSITQISDGAFALSESFVILFVTPIRGGVTDQRGYLGTLLRLNLLAPDLVGAILIRRQPQKLPVGGSEQPWGDEEGQGLGAVPR